MRVPVIRGVIRRRLLVNFRGDPAVVQRQLPVPFRPKLHRGHAIAGICMIRLEEIRPRRMPRMLGLSSENAAHRIAVLWEEAGATREGVYIPRRDTGSRFNHLAGGRTFPGEHHRAAFQVREEGARIELDMRSLDGSTHVSVAGSVAGELPVTSVFETLEDASAFFRTGALGYSEGTRGLDGVVLKVDSWSVEPLAIEKVESSYFSDPGRFPSGSLTFDCALRMRDIGHEWHTCRDLPSR